MKKAIIILSAIVAIMAIRNNQQRQIVKDLTKQIKVTNQLLEQVRQDNEDYYYDVLAETDAYADYITLNY